jgi:hypothetical protein
LGAAVNVIVPLALSVAVPDPSESVIGWPTVAG